MPHEPFQYHVIVIRVWSEATSDSRPRWRLTLDWPSSHERLGFTDVRALLDHVETGLATIVNDDVTLEGGESLNGGEPPEAPSDARV